VIIKQKYCIGKRIISYVEVVHKTIQKKCSGTYLLVSSLVSASCDVSPRPPKYLRMAPPEKVKFIFFTL